MPFGQNDSVDGITNTISGLNVSGEKGKYVPPHLRNRPEPSSNWADQAEDVDPRDNRGGGGGGGWDRSGSWGVDRRGGGGGSGGGDRWEGGSGGYRGDRRDSYGGGAGGYGRDSRDSRDSRDGRGSFGGGRGGGRGGFGGLDRWSNWRDTRHDPAAREQTRNQKPTVADPVAQELFGAVVNTGLNFEAYEDIPVETSGERCPPPLTSFDDVDLGDVVTNNVILCKYTKPTPVQKTSIPIILESAFNFHTLSLFFSLYLFYFIFLFFSIRRFIFI